MIKKVIAVILVMILPMLSSCGYNNSTTHSMENKILVQGADISFISQTKGVSYLNSNGTCGTYPNSDDAKAIFGDYLVTIILKNDASVTIYSTEKHEPIDSKYCEDYFIEHQDEGTGNGTIGTYYLLCTFFEEHSRVEDILYWDNENYAAKVNGVWYGPLVDNYPEVDFSETMKIVGADYPEYILKKDGHITPLSEVGNPLYRELIEADVAYKDMAVGLNDIFLLDKTGKVYSAKTVAVTDWEEVDSFAEGVQMNLVAIGKEGSIVLQSKYGRLSEETREWKNIVYAYNGGDYLVCVDKEGYIIMTSEAADYFGYTYKDAQIKIK